MRPRHTQTNRARGHNSMIFGLDLVSALNEGFIPASARRLLVRLFAL